MSFGKFGAKPAGTAPSVGTTKFGAGAGTGATTAPKFGVGAGAGAAGTTPKFGAPAAAAAGATTAPKFGASAVAGTTTAPKFGTSTATTSTAPKFGATSVAGTATTSTAPKFGAKATVAITPGTTTAATTTAAPAGAATTTAAPAGTTSLLKPKFGATTPAATSAATTPAAATATTTTAAATTTATTAPTAAAATGSTFSSRLGAASTSTAASATAAAAKTPAVWKPNVDVAALLKGKTLEEMINEWSGQIDEDINQFTQMAMMVAEWDRKVSSNSEKILDLKEKVDLVEAAQSELNKNLELITAQQSQLSTVLTALEQSVEKWSLTVDLGPQDAERERGYALADDIDVQLNQMSNKLKEMIDRLNASQERESAKDGDHPAFQILQILDSHLNSLAWIDNTSNELAARLSDLQSQSARRAPPSNHSYPDTHWGSRYY